MQYFHVSTNGVLVKTERMGQGEKLTLCDCLPRLYMKQLGSHRLAIASEFHLIEMR